jgi:hypothetical protein
MCRLGALIEMQVGFQSARPPTAQALPLKTEDFGTSPPGSSIQIAFVSIQAGPFWRKGQHGRPIRAAALRADASCRSERHARL